MIELEQVENNARSILSRVASAAVSVGRRPESVRLLAATKMNDTAHVRAAIQAGIAICGENRVQEMREKLPQGAYEGAELHFIGHLQKNKVKDVVGVAALIHSVDSTELMDRISLRAETLGIVQDILLEINIGDEDTKSGVSTEKLPELLAHAAVCPGLHVCGLMAIPPADASPLDTERYFSTMYQLFVDNQAKKYDNVSLGELSMGMSGDFESAIRHGATIVRVGSGIFGARNYNKEDSVNGSVG